MGNTYFFTGFPGFISINIIKSLLKQFDNIEKIYLLSLPSTMKKAEQIVQQLLNELDYKEKEDLFELIEGDITKENLNIGEAVNKKLKEEVTHVFHLAAIYDLAVSKDLAVDVNVNGTYYVNDWVKKLNHLERYVYFSTAYVAGTREGKILETELEMHQGFKNHYEKTKYDAEVLVKKLMAYVPTTIIRPGVVMGHSETGETIKFDGPYFILNFFDRLKFMPIIPYLGKGEGKGNFVPIDYIINASLYLSHSPKGVGKTYHLADPNPYKMKDIYRIVSEEYLGRKPVGTIPLSLAKAMLSIPFMRKWLRVEKESLDYFIFKAEHDCSQAEQDLARSGITCPDFKDAIKPVIAFYKEHKNDASKHIKIV